MIIEQSQFPNYPINTFHVNQETLAKVFNLVNGYIKIYPQSETLLLNYSDGQQPLKLRFYPSYFSMNLYIQYQPSIPVQVQMDKLMITRQDRFDDKEFLLFIHSGYLEVKNEQLQFFYIFMMTVELQMPINIIHLMIGQLCDEGLFNNCNFKRKKALHIIIYLSENQYFMNLVQNNQQISLSFQILINRILTQTIPLICQQEDPNTKYEYRITAQRMNKFTYSAIVNYLNTQKGDDVFLQLYQITRLICLNQQQVNQEIEMIYLSQTLRYYKLEDNPEQFYLELSQNLRDTLSSIFEKSSIPTYHIYNQCQSRQKFFSSCGHQLCIFCTANYVCYKKDLKNQSDNKLKQYEENIRCPSRITDHRICDKCLTREDIEKLIKLAPKIIEIIQ